MTEQGFSKSFQDSIIAGLIIDSAFLGAVRSVLPASSFLSPVARKLVGFIYEFYDQNESAPEDHFSEYLEYLVSAEKFNAQDSEICREYLSSISGLRPNTKYLSRRISLWVRRQAIKSAYLESAPLVETGTPDSLAEAESLISKAFTIGVENSAELGVDVFASAYKPPENFKPDMKFFIPALDAAIRGAKRGRVHCIHGRPGIGKSWCLANIAVAALMQGLTVAFYTGEMGEDEVIMRFAQMIGGLADRPLKMTRGWDKDKGDWKEILNPRTVESPGAVKGAIDHIKGYGGRLFIKEFVPKEFTMKDVDMHMHGLELVHNVHVDVSIFDYDELFASVNDYKDQTRLGLSEIYYGCLALAKKRHLMAFIGSQSNRSGLDAKVVNMKHLAEDFGKAKVCHVMISQNQTDEEYRQGIMRLFVYKNRGGPCFMTIKLWQNFDIGQFCLHSRRVKGSTEEKSDD